MLPKAVETISIIRKPGTPKLVNLFRGEYAEVVKEATSPCCANRTGESPIPPRQSVLYPKISLDKKLELVPILALPIKGRYISPAPTNCNCVCRIAPNEFCWPY